MAEGKQTGGLQRLETNKAQGHQAQQVAKDKEALQDSYGDKEDKHKESKNVDCLIWHARLGHGSMSKLAHLTCISKHVTERDISCETCILAKFHRQLFPVSKSMA